MADSEASRPPTVDDAPIAPVRENVARRNSLEQHLMHRPERSELIEKNILPASTAAPSIQAQQKELAKHMRMDTLNEKISHRPQPEKLLHDGVLREDPREPGAADKYSEAIEEEYAKREGGA